ncbi:unnamed protein product [Miscanthus lutarioriparius]|uniref:Auxin-responsive protein n=1 Tax=Miscanthus lutarioriparius TaxID=422564 RepID=A0A811MEU4_9POAL|nr:unnamed protein product [Miscanthus lutarioriparius]
MPVISGCQAPIYSDRHRICASPCSRQPRRHERLTPTLFHGPRAPCCLASSTTVALVFPFAPYEVSMDGKPYLRKVDVASYDDYDELAEALSEMFCYCSIRLMDMYGDLEHAMVFEDSDSNWMLLMCRGSKHPC